jgi:UDP-GlcNAc:undecaprenyl-phosphate GlcNAc-1-phosphate transferase
LSVLDLFFSAAASFCVALLAIVALRPLAIAVDLVDKPGGRKTHHGEVPIVGGLAMLLGLLVGSGMVPLAAQPSAAFFATCALLVTVGLLDDRFDISPWARLPVQAAAAVMVCIGSGVLVQNLGAPFGSAEILLGRPAAVFLTVLLVMGAVNAFNMLDGMDGLAGATALLALLAIAYVAGRDGLSLPMAVSVLAAASVGAFLIFNLPASYNRSVRCFMGDAGSTLLGFVLAWLCVSVSQDARSTTAPVTVLWFVAMPLYELIWSTLRRVTRGVSPFTADTDHFHHLLLKAGFGVRGAFGVFIGLSFMLAAVGLAMDQLQVSDSTSFGAFLLAGVAVVRIMYRARGLRALFPASFRRVPDPVAGTPAD